MKRTLHKHGFISGFLHSSLISAKNQSREGRGKGKISRDAIPDLPQAGARHPPGLPPRGPRGGQAAAGARRPSRARENRLGDPAPPPPTHLRRPQPLRSSSAPAHPHHPTGQPRPLRLLLLEEPETRPPFHWPAAPSVYPRERRVKGARGGEAGPALIGQSAVASARRIGRRDPRRP